MTKEKFMILKADPTDKARFLRPVAIILAVVAVGLVAIWQVGPTAYSKTNPYSDDLEQNPTGAGSNPDGPVSVLEDRVPVERNADEVIEGSADATDLTGITRTQPEDTVADEGNRLLEPGDVISRDEGEISNETGTVLAPEDS
jgi:hypothetical protein